MLHRILSYQKTHKFPFIHYSNQAYRFNQRFTLVNVKLKWVKDNVLDSVVTGEKDLKAASLIVSIIASDPAGCLPVYRISGRRKMGFSGDLKVSTFMRKYPNIFNEFYVLDSGGTSVPWFRLTPDAIKLNQEQITVFQENQKDYVNRLSKLLMMTKDKVLPLQTIDQLRWDLGLPFDYADSFIPSYKDVFDLIRLCDDRVGLKLVSWPDTLPDSHLEMERSEEGVKSGSLAFRVGFPRGFGLKRKCIKWLEEWQKLPYTSPYYDPSHLDSRTDVSEKRIVGVFHELLHLTVKKKTERQNVSNLRKPLALPQKFTKVFERHPGIFYISKKNGTQTVVLREGYDRDRLVSRHPICEVRDRFGCLMKEGFLDRSRGLYKKRDSANETCENGFESDGRSMFPEYESDECLNL